MSKYRVLSRFVYKGKDGKEPPTKWIAYCPGDKVPTLDKSEIERLTLLNAICEVSENGENVISKKLTVLNAEQVDKLFTGKSPSALLTILKTTYFEKETLARMLYAAEARKLPEMVISTLNEMVVGTN
jgi:hypothetical protein